MTSSSSPVLFLDIDGVILSGEELWASRNHRYLPEAKISLLNLVCMATGCNVVISSTWRLHAETPMLLRAAGLVGKIHKDWRTTSSSIDGDHRRGRQIEAWLSRHPRVERYAILDDDSDMLESQRPFFVKPRFAVGMQRAHAEHLIAILNDTCTTAPHLWPEIYDPRTARMDVAEAA